MSPPAPARTRGGPLAVLAVLFAVLVWPLLFTGRGGTSEAKDQQRYHLPIIAAMAMQWPRPDIVDYKSATAPGYHLLLAAATRWLGLGEMGLRWLSSLWSGLLVLAVYWCTARLVDPWPALLLTLPVLLCTYVLSGAIWLTTDNAALLWVVLAVSGAVTLAPTPGRCLRWGFYTTLAVAIRQIHLWPVAAIGLAGMTGSKRESSVDPKRRERRSRAVLIATAVACLLPCALLVVFVLLWGGLTPPAYRDMHDAGINFATVPFALALAGGFGIFYLPAAGAAVRALRGADPVLWAVAAVALATALLFRTEYDAQAGRWGGSLWTLVRHLPDVAGRSLLLPPLAMLGAVVLLVLYRNAAAAGRGSRALILLLTLLGFVAAQSFNSQCFQRYLEPMLLIGLGWLAALGSVRSVQHGHVRLLRGSLLALAALQAIVSLLSVYLPALRWSP